MSFSWPVRIYWEDTDAGGVVYYANYLRFMERARTEWLRARGVHQSRLRAETGVVMVVRDIVVSYHQPARLDDELAVLVAVNGVGGTRFEMEQQVLRQPEGTLLVEATVTAACLDSERWRPRRMPEVLRRALADDDTQSP